MKKLLILILWMVITFQKSYAQNESHESNPLSFEELQLKKYEKDPSVEAAVIYDRGKTYFNLTERNGFELVFERKTRIKIFTKAGLKWAQISIPYYEENNKSEGISELTGITYNKENGTIRKTILDSRNTYNEKDNNNWYNKKFAMPDVKEGSIIEFSYTVRSPYLFNFRSWEFQSKIPILHSEYTVKMIPFYEYIFILQGAKKFDEFTSQEEESMTGTLNGIEYKNMVSTFAMNDVPAFKDESFITTINDYIIKLDFQLTTIHRQDGIHEAIMTTWPELSKELTDNESFGKYLKNCMKKCSEIVENMQLTSKSALEKAKIIERYIKTNFNWNGHSNKFTSNNAKDFLTEKTGNSADINLFLVGMLNAAGIEAKPVIISTRDHGKINPDYPFQHFFNYVVALAEIDSSFVLLDATEPFSNFSEIPSRCINDKGFVIQKNKVEWVNLKGNSVSSRTYYIKIQLSQGKDSIIQDCRLTTTGYEAIDYRKMFSNSYKNLKSDLLDNNAVPGDTLLPLDLNQIEKPFKIEFNKKTNVEIIDDKIIISPFCNFALSENPLTQPTRSYPVDFIYKKSNNFQTTIAIPDGYTLMTKPIDMKIDNKLVEITYITDESNKGFINIIGNYEFKKDVYEITDYTEIKKYFNIIVEKFNEGIVIKKEI